MSGLLSHSKNSIPVWFRLFWWAEELHALSYVLLCSANSHPSMPIFLWLLHSNYVHVYIMYIGNRVVLTSGQLKQRGLAPRLSLQFGE